MATATSAALLHDTALVPIREKVLAGVRLSFDDGLALYRTQDLLGLGALANHVRELRHGDAAYFVRNTHVNHTNVCVATCDFCAFAARKDEPRVYTMAVDEVVRSVSSLPKAVREVHVVGGLHPDLPFSYFTGLLKGIKAVRPDIHVKAFTAVEVFFFHRLYKKSVERVLTELKEAGLDSMPGGGAEISSSVNAVPNGKTGRQVKPPMSPIVKKTTALTGEHLQTARVNFDQFNEAYVTISFDTLGSKIFERITRENVKKRLAIILDNNVYSAPVIQERIAGGRAQITGRFDTKEASDLAIVLRAGALPAPVKIIEERTVGPSLGQDSIQKGIIST